MNAMSTHEKTLEALNRHAPMSRVAAEEGAPPFPPKKPFGGGGNMEPTKRKIPKDFDYDLKAIKPLIKVLWATSVSLGHALTAHRQFARLKSATFSPDGLVGGHGYVLGVKDVRSRLFEACENLSAIIDTLHDEVNAPHWKSKIGELEKKDLSDVKKLLGDAEEIMDDPEGEVEDEWEAVEKGKSWTSERFDSKDDAKASQVPGGGNHETVEVGDNPAGPGHPSNTQTKQSSSYTYCRVANSSEPVNTLPGGPRVDHLDRAEDRGPWGSYNEEEPEPAEADKKDEWSTSEGVGNEYNYPSVWENDFSSKAARSSVPDSVTDSTPTEGYDWGIGDGNGNDAHGQGAGGYGLANPSTGDHGVYGPRADLPSDFGGKTKPDESDSNAVVESEISGHSSPASTKNAAGVLPNDTDEPVARSDYYRPPKGNDMNVTVRGQTELPGEQPQPELTPVTPRPAHLGEHMFADSGLPGQDETNTTWDKDMSPNNAYRYERPDTTYVKWDDNTHEQRPDTVHQRDPVQGPYVKQGI